jgi:PKD repeat protein
VAHASATPSSGPAPLAVTLSGIGSTDADPGQQSTLTYKWDLDDDGAFDDATGILVHHTFTEEGTTPVHLLVTDTGGGTSEASVDVLVGNDPPVPVIDLPVAGPVTPFTVVDFAGHATDPQDGALADAALHWKFTIQHCVSVGSCHEHPVAESDGVSSGEFIMPTHEFPSVLDVTLTATDSDGVSVSTTVQLAIDV